MSRFPALGTQLLVTGKVHVLRDWRGPTRGTPARSEESDEALVVALRSRESHAMAELFDRYGKHVYRVLIRTLGPDAELGDLLHDVFVQAIESIHDLKDASRLKGWLASIAVFIARGAIRRRQRLRWLGRDPSALPSWSGPSTATSPSPEISEALRSAYTVLARLPVDERLAFALRFVDGMKLEEVAEACNASLATVKRRISRGEKRFRDLASAHPSLGDWLARGTRWSDETQD